MTTDTEAAAQQADVFMEGKKKADDVAFMLGQVLKLMGIDVGDPDSWPQLMGRASLSGEPSVFLGSVPLPTAKKIANALVYAESARRSQDTQT
ncbi:hypothetical protein [Streptomyces blastmyceticus]